MLKHTLFLTLLVFVGLGVNPAGQSGFDRQWSEIVSRLERADLGSDETALREARAACMRTLDGPIKPAQAAQVRYAVAYANWRLVYFPSTPEDQKDTLLDEAVEQLRQALTVSDRNAEAHALLGAVYGSKIGFASWKGMVLGPRASNESSRAAEIEPNNPRVILVQAVNTFNTPAMFGGSVEKAETLLKRAITLFEAEPADRPWPNWGRVDAHAWLGQALANRGDPAGARAQYEQGLSIAPNNGWIKYVLLPRLEKGGK